MNLVFSGILFLSLMSFNIVEVMTMTLRSTRSFLLFFLLLPSAWGVSNRFGGSSEENVVQEELVSPIVNRELEASVVAHDWPFLVDNIYCEAWAYHGLKDWGYMDRFVELMIKESGDKDVEQATKVALEATVQNPALLQYSLSLRAHSPLCEMHRTLARQVVLSHTLLASQEAFVVANQKQVATTPAELASMVEGSTDNYMEELLPDETVRGEAGRLVVLYANMGSSAFVDLYKALVESNQRFVLRHRGHVTYEEVGGNATVLQGYGVRLDIRNVEYRVFDDRSEGNLNEASLLNVSSLEGLTDHALAGIQVSALKDLTEAEALKLQQDLWKLHGAQQIHSQLVPPKWQRRQLALQAATVISQASDVLLTLQDISQNLPSVASTLVHVAVSEETQTLSDLMEPIIRQSKGVALTINGRRVPVGRPSFNVFELLQMLQEEQQSLDDMQGKLSPYLSLEGLRQVQKAWTLGKDHFLQGDSPAQTMAGDEDDAGLSGNTRRIDVGRDWKGSIVYVNDVEKDAQYRGWPRSLQEALMSMQFGAPPSVRRNLFTMLCVMDPTEEGADQHIGYNLGMQLMQASYPTRVGYLIVNNKDLQECREWIETNGITDESLSCPTKPILTSKQANMLEMAKIEGSTHAAHRLISKVATKYAGQEIPGTFMEYFVRYLDQYLEGGGLTIEDMVTVFGQLMEGLVGMKMKESSSMAIDALLEAEDDDNSVSSYGKSLRFAINKAISPGMGFINGRPLPQSETGDPGQIFMEEQNHVFGLIMKGEITDQAPKSVYGKLLKGEGVFKRLHPLLSDSGNDGHLDLTHDLSTGALLFPESHSLDTPPEAVFVIEAVVDLETPEGLTFASRFVEIMDAYPVTVEAGEDSLPISIGYRIVASPSSSAAPVCSILANAAIVGANGLRSILSQEELAKKSTGELLALIPTLDAKQKETISSFSCSGSWSSDEMPTRNFVTVNGKAYAPETGAVAKDDIELLIDIERSRSKATTRILKDDLSFNDNKYHDAVAKASIFLAIEHGKEQKSQRMDMVNEAIELEKKGAIESNPFRFSWNMDDQDELKLQVSIAIDPATEAAQRVAPFLLVFRDVLKLPLQMVLVPKPLVGDDKSVPITSYYRFVADPQALSDTNPPKAAFSYLPTNHILTLRLDVPESWNVQQTHTIQDTDNLRCDVQSGCSDDAHIGKNDEYVPMHERRQLTSVEYGLESLLFFGQCYDASTRSPPNGLQLILSKKEEPVDESSTAEVSSDGSVEVSTKAAPVVYSDTLVMKNVGYWQLRANPGVWQLEIAPESRGAEIFDIVDGTINGGKFKLSKAEVSNATKTIYMKDFTGGSEVLVVKRRSGWERASLFYEDKAVNADEDDVINVFSLATGHLYERFLKIMMLSVTKRTSSKVKFWLFENFLSPSFKGSAKAMAERIGCEVEFVTYKWPEWLRGQSEKQRIIWGYKILFLDVLFPLNVKKIIYVDADQVVRGDLKELWDMDLEGAPYGYTPMCSSRETTIGFQFWNSGFWEQHLNGKPYHISALYVVDLEKFRKDLVGDNLRSTYQQLSADPNSLANLDQDLPNYAQHQVPIFSLPQEWLWCESWCSDETKATSKTIDLCNNPLHKEPKVNMAKRIISGPLFEESWVELDAEVEGFEKDYLTSLQTE